MRSLLILLTVVALFAVAQAKDCQERYDSGISYSGNVAKTKTGKTCQAWTSQEPHAHGQTAAYMPEESLEEANNYCRNPDRTSAGVWCYTTDSGERWDYCDVDFCEVPYCQLKADRGTTYSGKVAQTETGKTCQAWTSQEPHAHGQTAAYMPEDSLEDAENYCRNPDNTAGGVWCYTTDPDSRWELCDVDACAVTNCQRKRDGGTTYTGQVAQTNTGKTCQAWTSQEPHAHGQTAAHMLEDSLEEAKNYCRNPDRDTGGVWCYTTDSASRWEYCHVKLCGDKHCQRKLDRGTTYSGDVAKTETGKTCQAWTSQEPHSHGQTADSMPEDSLSDAKNYCRNPDETSGGVWCYTTDPNSRWELCDVKFCGVTNCQRKTDRGTTYTGQVAKTETGKTCQAWTSQEPHAHSQTAAHIVEDSLEDAKNYCRNPDQDVGGVWCYTTDSASRWEYCDVKLCGESTCQRKLDLGTSYSGDVAKTETGKTCQAWTSQEPHSHGQTADSMPEESLSDAKNYCRNPDETSGGVWCYTTDPNSRWELCDVKFCGVTDCQRKSDLGVSYSGGVSKTVTGKRCQAWTAQEPHAHSQTADKMIEDSLEEAENYCRNPDETSGGVWCYTTDPDSRWELCDVDFCEDLDKPCGEHMKTRKGECVCERGYRLEGEKCVAMDCPENEELRGSKCYCIPGTSRIRGECLEPCPDKMKRFKGSTECVCRKNYDLVGGECVRKS